MANYNCSSCEDLRTTSPNFVVNGITDTECTSLQNDTGLNPSSGHDDCTDLDNINDCLVGNMADEVEAYDVCDWKTYMKKFVPNVWTTIKSIICAICGLWTISHKLECITNYMVSGASFKIGEQPSAGSYVVAGQGVTFYQADGSQELTSDVTMLYVAGGLLRVYGSCRFYKDNFTDAKVCPNWDGNSYGESKNRSGNNVWDGTGHTYNGGEMVYEIRIKKSQYPQLKTIYGGFGMESNAGAFHAHLAVFDGDNIPTGQSHRYAYGIHGQCHDDGTAWASGYSAGHVVPSGWIYAQVRINWIALLNPNGSQYTPTIYTGIRLDKGDITC